MASPSIARADPAADLRASARIAAAATLLLVALPIHGLFRLFGSRRVPPVFLGLVGRIFGARARRVGPAATEGLIVSNHIGWIDILVLGGTTGTAFIAKAEIRDWPLVGWLSALNQTVFVARGERAGVGAQVAALREALGRQQPVTLFAEGTTSDGRTLLPFKPALFEGVAPPPRALMVQPVWIDYGRAAADIAWKPEESARDAGWRLLGRRGSFDVTVHMLSPFDPVRFGDRKAVAAEARRRILAAASQGYGGAAASL